MNNFSSRLEILIKENKTKKKDLAAAIGLTPSAITDMVKGRSNSTTPTRRAIANYYHVSEEWLEYGTGEIMEPQSGYNARQTNLIPVYGSVPAGWPDEPIDRNETEAIDWIPVEGSIHGVGALRVEGHSMAPEIRDGIYVLYIQDYDIKQGDIIVATDEFNRAMVKQYVLKDGEPWLISINPEYPNFKVNDHYKIIGRVFEKYDKSRVGRGR
jgi:SOS-response transcriptional repressor LexA